MYIVNDNFRVDSFIPDVQGVVKRSIIDLSKPSLVKIIIEKESHSLGFELMIYKTDGISDKIQYSANNLSKKSTEVESKDICFSVLLSAGTYTLKIRSVLSQKIIRLEIV